MRWPVQLMTLLQTQKLSNDLHKYICQQQILPRKKGLSRDNLTFLLICLRYRFRTFFDAFPNYQRVQPVRSLKSVNPSGCISCGQSRLFFFLRAIPALISTIQFPTSCNTNSRYIAYALSTFIIIILPLVVITIIIVIMKLFT